MGLPPPYSAIVIDDCLDLLHVNERRFFPYSAYLRRKGPKASP
jgi:hypothetical protein